MSGEHLDQVERSGRLEGPAVAPRRALPADVRDAAAGRASARATPAVAAVAALPLLGLQHAAGNAAVLQLLGVRPTPAAEPVVQRIDPPKAKSELPENYGSMSDAEKAVAISDLLAKGASAATFLSAWGQLGDALGVARKDPGLFTGSVAHNDAILDLPAFDDLRSQFKSQVEETARGYLSTNKKAVLAERERTGVAGPVGESVSEQVQSRADIFSGKGSSEATNRAVQDIQAATREMGRVKELKAKMLDTQVGQEKRGQGDRQDYYPVMFKPGSPPRMSAQGCPTYAEVMAQWTKNLGEESRLVRLSPSAAFFIGEGGDPAKIGEDKHVREARAEIAVALTDLEKKIDAAIPLIGNGIDFKDMVPIQQELLAGPVWGKPVERAIARETTADANVADLLKSLGVSTLSAAAFLFAPMTGGASAGLATFLFAAGVMTSGAQAAMSWDKYADLAAAHRGSIDPAQQVVSEEQVSAALISAVLDTIFVVVDGWQAATGAAKVIKAASVTAKAARAGESIGATAVLKNINAADSAAVARAIGEVGPDTAKEISGLGYAELAKKVGGDTTTLGCQLIALAERGGAMSTHAKELVAKLPKVASLPENEAREVLQEGLNQFGFKGTLDKVGGWAAIERTAVMKAGSGPAAALEGWRSGIAKELDAYVTKASDELARGVRTGSEKASSDLDVQILGESAAQLQREAEAWLAGRLGTSYKDASRLLNVTVFIDPTRAHLFDLMKDISEDVRNQIRSEMAGLEPPLILAARLKSAEEVGGELGKELADKIRRSYPGITPAEGFVPLTVDQQKRYAVMIEEWMKDLKDPAKAEFKADRIRKVAKTQALINASHTDAYVGGGVAIWVTGREDFAKGIKDLDKIAEALHLDPASLRDIRLAQRISAALSEGKWLDKGLAALRKPAGNDINKLVDSIVDVAKHGERAAGVLQVPGVTNIGELSALMEKFRGWATIDRRLLAEVMSEQELAATGAAVTGALTNLEGAVGRAIGELEQQVPKLRLEPGQLEDFQRMLRWRDTYREFVRHSAAGVASIEAGLRETRQAQVQQETWGLPPSPKTAPPPPQQSVAPAPWEEPQSIPP